MNDHDPSHEKKQNPYERMKLLADTMLSAVAVAENLKHSIKPARSKNRISLDSEIPPIFKTLQCWSDIGSTLASFQLEITTDNDENGFAESRLVADFENGFVSTLSRSAVPDSDRANFKGLTQSEEQVIRSKDSDDVEGYPAQATPKEISAFLRSIQQFYSFTDAPDKDIVLSKDATELLSALSDTLSLPVLSTQTYSLLLGDCPYEITCVWDGEELILFELKETLISMPIITDEELALSEEYVESQLLFGKNEFSIEFSHVLNGQLLPENENDEDRLSDFKATVSMIEKYLSSDWVDAALLPPDTVPSAEDEALGQDSFDSPDTSA